MFNIKTGIAVLAISLVAATAPASANSLLGKKLLNGVGGFGGLGGAIAGGVIGNQFGSGSGNTAATIAGTILGNAVGPKILNGVTSPRGFGQAQRAPVYGAPQTYSQVPQQRGFPAQNFPRQSFPNQGFQNQGFQNQGFQNNRGQFPQGSQFPQNRTFSAPAPAFGNPVTGFQPQNSGLGALAAPSLLGTLGGRRF